VNTDGTYWQFLLLFFIIPRYSQSEGLLILIMSWAVIRKYTVVFAWVKEVMPGNVLIFDLYFKVICMNDHFNTCNIIRVCDLTFTFIKMSNCHFQESNFH
jgi:hypothetical protein